MNRTVIAFVGAAALLFAHAAFADNTDEATITVQGHVVAPLEITQTTAAVTMPDLVIPAAGEPNTGVILNCDASSDASNVVEYTNNGNPFADGIASSQNPQAGSANAGLAGAGATGQCAQLEVTGESDYNLVLSIANITNPTTPGIALTPRCTDEIGQIFGSAVSLTLSGTDLTVRCGGTVSAASSAVDYTDGSYTVVVTYD
jgi:hypothetical protein